MASKAPSNRIEELHELLRLLKEAKTPDEARVLSEKVSQLIDEGVASGQLAVSSSPSPPRTTRMSKKRSSKRPRPSYQEGELRDKRIEAMQDATFSRNDLTDLVRRGASDAKRPHVSSDSKGMEN